MVNAQLETFIHVADAGSFNKAAEEFHITSTAVLKQINTLEAELGVTLFNRTHRGLVLTRAGESIYKDAKYMMEYSRKAIARAKAAMQEESSVVRIGTSPMTPAQLLTDLWPQIHRHCANVSFQLVPYEKLRGCAGFEITREPICCALSIYHPLAGKERLTIEDLFGENLMIIRRGWSRYMDEVRDRLSGEPVNLIDFDFYEVDVFNQCEQQKNIMLVIEKWACVHPMMKVCPVDWDYAIPFGVLHAAEPSKTVREFLAAVKKVV